MAESRQDRPGVKRRLELLPLRASPERCDQSAVVHSPASQQEIEASAPVLVGSRLRHRRHRTYLSGLGHERKQQLDAAR
jgi:hypothetical protein